MVQQCAAGRQRAAGGRVSVKILRQTGNRFVARCAKSPQPPFMKGGRAKHESSQILCTRSRLGDHTVAPAKAGAQEYAGLHTWHFWIPPRYYRGRNDGFHLGSGSYETPKLKIRDDSCVSGGREYARSFPGMAD